MTRRIIPSLILLVSFASPSVASDLAQLEAEFKTAKKASEKAEVEFEIARLAYEQAQVEAEITRIRRNELRIAFQTVRFNNKIPPNQRVQARADWQRSVADYRTALDNWGQTADTFDVSKARREQAKVGFEAARAAYNKARYLRPLEWAGTAVVAAAALAAYPLWLTWPFLAFQ